MKMNMHYSSIEARTLAHLSTPEPTMSSKDFVKILNEDRVNAGKEPTVRHDNVKRTMDTMANRGVIAFTQIEENPSGALGGRPGTVYHVNERDSYVVMAQLSPEFTARLVDEWRRLKEQVKNKPQLPAFTNPAIAAAARAWAEEYEKNQQLKLKVEEDAPKVNYADTVLLASEGEPALDN
jgi:phage regulator Rha-like protein